ALSITPGHLNRICRAATGESASRHIEKAVMTEASRLLAFTRLSVAEIGYRLGFSDPSYFSRRFRVMTGQSPTTYRDRFTD
ncbi:helix-turn-helix transcriptional regulator, partial [Paracoccus sp. PXZ]